MAAIPALGIGAALAFAGTLTPCSARADSASIVSTPLASEIAASTAQRTDLASLLNWNKNGVGVGLSGSATVTSFNLSQGGGFSVSDDGSVVGGAQAGAGAPTHGVNLFYYNSGSGLGGGLNSLMPSSTAYGLVEHLSLLGGDAATSGTGASAPAASSHAPSLNLTGQYYSSNASASQIAANGGSGIGLAPGKSTQAYDQHLAYAGQNMSFTASLSSIGKDFSDGGAFGAALASDDQATRDAANSLLTRRGQTENNLAFSLGAAKQFGQFTYNQDNLDDKLNIKKTASQSLGYTWGDSSKTQFSFQNNIQRDLLGHTHNDSQTFGLSQMVGKLLQLQASHAVQSQGDAKAADTTTDNLHLSLSPDKRLGLGMDATEKIASDTFGGSDRAMNLNLHRTLGGTTLGFLYGDEQRKSIASAGAAAALASIRTIGYSASRQISKMFSVDTNWQDVHDTSRCKGQRRIATETTHFNFTPFKDFALKDQYTANNGINNRQVSASYSLPKTTFALLGFGQVSVSAINSETSAIDATFNQASMQTRKIALDTTLPRRVSLASLFLPSFLSTDTTLHLELGQARIDDFKNSSGQLSRGEDANVRLMRMSGSLTAWKSAKWSYTYASQTPTNAGVTTKLPNAHEFDFSAPVSKMTLAMYDHDQIDQGGGNYKHATDRHVSLTGALTKTLNLTAETGESRDFTLANPSHTRMIGLHLTGKHGAMQNIDIKLQRQLESEVHNGRNNQTVYGVNFNLPQTDTRKLTLNCAVTDNKYIDRPASTGKMDATVGFDFAQQF